MDYPLFSVPYVGGGWLIGAVAILHVIIAHFAVGGGLLLVVTEQVAARRGDAAWLAFVRRQSLVLVLLATVLGALTGVGIWFTIGLVHPAATAALIHNFVWGWAIEWVFFIVEMAAALLYVATWDRVSRRFHLAVGWIYFAAAYVSLVIINGIVTFMLTPGRWLETRDFWHGVFNPTFWPSLVLRTGVTLAMAGVYAWLVAAWGRDREARRPLARYLGGWILAGTVLTALGFAWWQARIPAGAAALVFPPGALLRPTFLAGAAALALLAALAVAVAYLRPRSFGVAAAVAAVILAGTVLGTYERIREGARKPFVIHGYMYSNGVLVEDVERRNREGFLAGAPWAGVGVAPSPTAHGERMFRAQCQACHTLDGYLAIRPLVAGLDAGGLTVLLGELRAGRPGMPPVVGTEEEVGALATYLAGVGGAAAVATEGGTR